jgi:arylsulfatase A-like enzyme
MRRAHRERAQVIPELLEKYGITARGTEGPQHIIIIVIDALRRDHLSLYGYPHKTTPFLDSLAAHGAVFERAITAGGWTYPAVGSMLTGFYPHNHGGLYAGENLRNFNNQLPKKIRADILSLPEFLEPFGFESYFGSGITAAAMATTEWFKHSSVFLGTASQHVKHLIRWLWQNRTPKSFCYLHLSDLHAPINAPKSYRRSFGPIADIHSLGSWPSLTDAKPGDQVFESHRENRQRLYDCALLYVDGEIARLFSFLKDAGIIDNSLVVITADHGEEFWEHVEVERELFLNTRSSSVSGHGHNLFQEIIAVPLLCTGFGITPGRYWHNVSLVDIVPTILDVCGVEHATILDGQNLFEPSADRILTVTGICYGYEKTAIIKNNWKLIHSKADCVSLLFDVNKDPMEQRDLSKDFPEMLDNLKSALPTDVAESSALKITRDVEKQLKDLGYM